MGIFDSLLGKKSADASRKAAADQYAKQQAATQGITDYGDKYAASFSNLAQGYDPYVETGYTANSALQNLYNDPSSVRSLPGYQFALDEGARALDRSAASRGMLNSGRSAKDLLRYGTGYADQIYGNQLARLMAGSQQGMGAVGAQNATTGQGLAGQLATRQAAFGGNMASAGTIGQGDIAAAQAEQSALQNLLSTGVGLAGLAMGSPGGFGALIGGGSRASSYKPTFQDMGTGFYSPVFGR